MYANFINPPRSRSRRSYSQEFKSQLVKACLQPGISIAAVALANGLNANLLRRWVKECRDVRPEAGGLDQDITTHVAAPTKLVPVALSLPEQTGGGEIKIEIQRPQATFSITWPASQADSCAQWLRELLR